MCFSYNYSLVQKIISIKSGILFAIKIENFWISNNNSKYEKSILIFKEKLKEDLSLDIFRHDYNTLFVLCNQAEIQQDGIHKSLIDIGFKAFGFYMILSVGYTYFFDEKPNDIIYNALQANALTYNTAKSKLCQQECKNKIKELAIASQKSTALYNALQNKELKLAFQPIVNIAKSEILFHEVLLRIDGQDAIHDFILAAEKTGLIFAIDQFVGTQSVYLMQETPDLKLSINVSAISINDSHWVDKMFSFFKSVPQIAKRTILEITENHIFNDYKGVFDFIFKFKSIGCQIAIDDFGQNFYLPFLNLEKLSANFIKLDRGFAKEITENKNIAIFTEAIVKVAENSGIKIIGEFVENQEILKFFKNMGINYMQGNYFGKASLQLQTSLNI